MILPKTGCKVKLVPFNPEFAPNIMAWFYDVKYQSFFRDFPDRALSIEDFRNFDKQMALNAVNVFMIILKETGRAVGLMTYTCLKKKSGVFRFGILLDASCQHNTYAIEAIILLAFYLFEHFGMQKYVVEFLSTDKHVQRISEKGGFRREGVFEKEALAGGEYVDEVRYFIDKPTAYELYGAYYRDLDKLPENQISKR